MPKYESITNLTPDAHGDYPDMSGSSLPLVWDMGFPEGVDVERISVNMRLLRSIHKTGGISASFVEGYGEAEDAGPEDTGQELSFASCLDPFDSYTQTPVGKVSLNASFGKAGIVHHINEPEISSRVASRLEGSGRKVTAEEAWAKQYDRAIRGAMREGANKHLVGRIGKLPPIYQTLAGVGLGSALWAAADIAFIDTAAALPPAILWVVEQASPYINPVSNRTRNDQTLERRWSIVPFGMQPDRYLAVNALSRVPGLIKAVK